MPSARSRSNAARRRLRRDLDGVEMPGRAGAGPLARRADVPERGEQRPVGLRQAAALGHEAAELSELRATERALQVGDAVVEAEILHLVVPRPVMLLEPLRRSRSMPWVRKRRQAAARRSSSVSTAPPSPVVTALTGWKERQVMSACRPTGWPPSVAPRLWQASAMSRRPVLVAERPERRVVGWVAAEVDRQDGPGTRRQRRAGRLGIEVVLVGIDVGEDRCRADVANAVGRSREGDRRHHHLVAGAEPGGEGGGVQRGRAVGQTRSRGGRRWQPPGPARIARRAAPGSGARSRAPPPPRQRRPARSSAGRRAGRAPPTAAWSQWTSAWRRNWRSLAPDSRSGLLSERYSKPSATRRAPGILSGFSLHQGKAGSRT